MIPNNSTNTITRNSGIDFLRILSMYMVIILHTLGQGGVLSLLVPGTTAYEAVWFLEIAAYCAVNCYALISGYVGCNAKFKLSRLINLWLQIVFYTLGLTLFFSITHPEFITGQTWLNACFPILNLQYWYLTCYFGMFIFIPVMNLALEQLEKKQLQFMITVFFIFFITIPSFTQSDLFSINGGFSVMWLCILYIIGGYLKRYPLNIPKSICFLLYILCIFITWILKMNNITFLLEYASPTIFGAAVSLLLIFANTNFNNTICKQVIRFLAPASLSVYIIQIRLSGIIILLILLYRL